VLTCASFFLSLSLFLSSSRFDCISDRWNNHIGNSLAHTEILNIIGRLLGAKVGKDAMLHPVNMTDHDLLTSVGAETAAMRMP
jgi:hypothetical protein